jgi:ribonuclease HI
MLELFAVIAYKLWLRRNRVVFDDLVLPPSCLLKGATEMLEDFRQSKRVASSIANDRLATSSQWVKPSVGTVKINWDAALCSSKKIKGVGVVARDATGAVKAALCSFLPYVSDPSVAESLGARQAVELGRKIGFPSIVLEGDVKEIVLGLGNPAGCSARLHSVLLECRSLLESFSSWSINHVRRDGNKAAHKLAKLVVSLYGNHVWVNVCPKEIWTIICNDSVS